MAGARGLLYDWEVKQDMIGSHKEQVITINGRHPSPTIQAHQGDSFRQSYQQVERECRDPLAQHPTGMVAKPIETVFDEDCNEKFMRQ